MCVSSRMSFLGLLLFSLAYSIQVEVDPPRGFFDKSVQVKLSFSEGDDTTVIRYLISETVGGVIAEPSMSVGTTYTTKLNISKTTNLRAMAYRKVNGNFVAVTTEMAVHSFIFPTDVAQQDTIIKTADAIPPNVPEALKTFVSIPSFIISAPSVYPTKTDRTDDPETTGFIEYINPDHKSHSFSSECEYSRRGGYSRVYPKKTLKIEFHGDLEGDIKFPLWDVDGLEDTVRTRSATKISKFVLRSSSDNSFTAELWKPVLYMRGIWNDLVNHELGLIQPHSRLVHYYFNNRYQGVVTCREILTDAFYVEYLGGNKTDYVVVDNGDIKAGSPAFFNNFIANKNWNYMKEWLDMDAFFTTAILVHFTCNFDNGETHNWFFAGPIYKNNWQGKNGGWKFYMHDNDVAMTKYSPSYPVFTGFNGSSIASMTSIYNLFLTLAAEGHPEFFLKFQDVQQRLLFKKNAVLSPANNIARFNKIIETFKFNTSIMGEIGRWGARPTICNEDGSQRCWNPNGFFLRDWQAGFDNILNEWLPRRMEFFIPQYQARNWVNPISAPTFSIDDNSVVADSVVVTITGTPGNKIVYTLNGEDCRIPAETGKPFGTINPNGAIVSTTHIIQLPAITSTTIITARQFQESTNKWSPIDKITVFINTTKCLLCGNIIFTEVNYNHKKLPKVAGLDMPDGSFLELKNIGNTDLVMTGATIKELRYVFPTLTLKPGQFWVIARLYEDFRKVYPQAYPNDTFTGRLGTTSDGDKFTLYDSVGRKIHRIEYSTSLPWSKLPDGYGPTLVADPQYYSTLANGYDGTGAEYYRYSTADHGSPWNDDPTPNWSERKISIIFKFISFEENWILLFNPTGVAIDLSNWTISERFNADKGKVSDFPKGTVIGPNSELKLQFKKDDIHLARDHNPVLFRSKPSARSDGIIEGKSTGDFLTFDVKLHQKALRS